MLSRPNTCERSKDEHLDRVFRALGDRTRRKLLARLAEGPAMVTELARPFNMTLPAVGKHLRVLESAGLVERTISGRVHHCALKSSPLMNADEWLKRYEPFWSRNLDALSEFVQSGTSEEKDLPGKKRS
jgi:DNA-binding transcriptional ArsR family regulator